VEQDQEEETTHDKAQLHGDSLIRNELPSAVLLDPSSEMLASHVRPTEMLGSERLAMEAPGNPTAEVPGSQILETEMPARDPVGAELTTRPTSHRQ
jgi:hypothetical protein